VRNDVTVARLSIVVASGLAEVHIRWRGDVTQSVRRRRNNASVVK